MNLIAFETATDACSCALLCGEPGGPILEQHEIAPRGHADRLLPMIEQLLAEAGLGYGSLDAIAFGRGPGSFTGIRIATGVAQGLAYALDLPVALVSTLDALALGAARASGSSRIAAGIDARMGEIYWALVEVDTARALTVPSPEALVAPDRAAVPEGGGWFGAGSAWRAAGDVLGSRFGTRLDGFDAERLPRARDVAALGSAAIARGEGVAAEAALPVYLRDRVAVPNVRRLD